MIWLGVRAPRGAVVVWDRFWGAVRDTGVHGDVLWDGGAEAEVGQALGWLLAYADRTLPVVDVGCGNGRHTRALAPHFPRAVGIDLSPLAVERARAESPGATNVTFRALDMGAPGAGDRLAAELGDANVYIRGVLHVIDHRRRVALLRNVRRLLGHRGVLYLLETDFVGGLLDYMERLGARPGALPPPFRRCIEFGLPPPRPFGARQHRVYFPERDWETLASGAAEVHAVPMRTPDRLERIAGFFAVVRPRRCPPEP